MIQIAMITVTTTNIQYNRNFRCCCSNIITILFFFFFPFLRRPLAILPIVVVIVSSSSSSVVLSSFNLLFLSVVFRLYSRNPIPKLHTNNPKLEHYYCHEKMGEKKDPPSGMCVCVNPSEKLVTQGREVSGWRNRSRRSSRLLFFRLVRSQ